MDFIFFSLGSWPVVSPLSLELYINEVIFLKVAVVVEAMMYF